MKKSYVNPEIEFIALVEDVMKVSVFDYQDDPFGTDVFGKGDM